ncbi:hypothetical protein BBP40_004315 [Aspergillus hancockii]|nr:hypothetical protein BBP40_004315 [Aspergillus hancockii]
MEECMDHLCILANVWPIAGAVVELLQSVIPQNQFHNYMAVAVEKYRQQASGNETRTDQSQPPTSFRRTKPKQIFLRRSRVIVRLMRAGTQPHLSLAVNRAWSASNPVEVEEESFEGVNSPDPAPLDTIDPSILECDPTVILQNLRECIRLEQPLCGDDQATTGALLSRGVATCRSMGFKTLSQDVGARPGFLAAKIRVFLSEQA